MTSDLVSRAIDFIKAQRFGDALPLLKQGIQIDPSNWNNLYMAGQCCRFLNDLPGAVSYLQRAAAIKSDEPSVLLALGIVLQLKGEFHDAVNAFRRAIKVDPDYELAYNSLAFTQKKMGELEKALHNYHAGVKALARKIVRPMQNSRASRIIKHRTTRHNLWVEHAMHAAIYLCSPHKSIERVAWPTGEQASEEERTERHAGLYWVDRVDVDGKKVRLFLPNYFNTFRETLRLDQSYCNLIGNRGTVLELLGRYEEAKEHFEEAEEFVPIV